MRKITTFNEQIAINPKIRFGKPCIKGTRIAVEDILNFIKAGYTFDEILKQYPILKKEDIIAALDYTTSVVLGREEIYSFSPH
ncbi:DUF433 domain-containing protein [Patescibacteria group bacterium]|nr:DUF433 domain-containing protein [Patescibacteria group bacterium]